MPKRPDASRRLSVVPDSPASPASPVGPPGDPLVVRQSALADFRHCPLKHYLGWHLGYFDPVKNAQGNRAKGNAWHRVMGIHYGEIRAAQIDGETPDLDYINELVTQQIQEENEDIQELLFWMYDGYVEKYGHDPDWEVLEVEQTLTVPFLDEHQEPFQLYDPWTGLVRLVLYEFTLDVLIQSREYRGLLVVDHKSTAQPLGKMDIDLSDQFGLYTVATNRRGMKVRGQLVSQAKTKILQRPMTLDERFTRYPSIRTPIELRSIEMDAIRTVRQMYSQNNVDGPYSAPDPRSCGWMCDFKEPHLRMRRMNDPKKLHALLKSHGLEPGATHR